MLVHLGSAIVQVRPFQVIESEEALDYPFLKEVVKEKPKQKRTYSKKVKENTDDGKDSAT